MAISRMVRNMVAGGVVGFGAMTGISYGMSSLLNESPETLRNTIDEIEKEGTKLDTRKKEVAEEIGAACFALLEPIYEQGMQFDAAVVRLARNPDGAVCGETEGQVTTAVGKVSGIIADIGANDIALTAEQNELSHVVNDRNIYWALGGFGGLFGVLHMALETRRSIRREEREQQIEIANQQ